MSKCSVYQPTTCQGSADCAATQGMTEGSTLGGCSNPGQPDNAFPTICCGAECGAAQSCSCPCGGLGKTRISSLFCSMLAFTSHFLLSYHILSVVCTGKSPTLHFPLTPAWKGLDHILGLPGTCHQGSAVSPGCLGATEVFSGWAGPEAVWWNLNRIHSRSQWCLWLTSSS